MRFPQNPTILFQGDSITDAKRDQSDPAELGRGYVLATVALLNALRPDLAPTCLNRGLSGNRTGDLLQRWQTDCLDLEPDVLSLLIGINDVWRRYDRNLPTSPQQFAENYRQLLQQTRTRLPDCRIILMEPFLLPVPEDRRQWREDLDPKIEIVRQMARDFEATLVPLDGIFAAASASQPPEFWAHDGVHPSPAGHGLIAQAWLKAAGLL